MEQQLTFPRADGSPLFYRHRPATQGDNTQAIVLFHGDYAQAQDMMRVAEELALGDFPTFAWDAREQDNSPHIADIDCFIKHIQREHGIAPENICVIAQSTGAVRVAGWLNDYAPRIRCAILSAPAFRLRLAPLRPALRLACRLRGDFGVSSRVAFHRLRRDSAPPIARTISTKMLLALNDLSQRVIANAHAINTPTQLLISGSDWVAKHAPQHDFYNNLGSHIKERHVFAGFYHDILGEANRAAVLEKMRVFIAKCFAEPLQVIDVTQNHLSSPSRVLAEQFATPLCRYSPRGAYWAAQRALLRFGAKLSYGLQTGAITGFDSGSAADYVYQNQANGENTFGDWLDKFYLNTQICRAMRQRKNHVAQAIQLANDKLRAANKKVHVLDMAAGQARYLFDAFEKTALPDSVRLRDTSAISVQAGQKRIAERGWQDIATFEQADAFHRDNYKKLKPRPTLGVVSGLYECFENNDLLLQSLKGWGETIAKGGYLIYTNQPRHPQQEYAARVLFSQPDGSPRVVRCRSQQEMDQLVEQAGFRKIQQWLDDNGIFTVSLAVKGEEHDVAPPSDDNAKAQFVDNNQTVVNW